MPLSASDLIYRLSTTTGSAGSSEAGTPAGSLGKWVSTTEITSATLHNLFDAVTGDENAASESEYRCIFIENGHPTISAQNGKAWFSSVTAGGADAEIGIDPTAASPANDTTEQAVEIADENTAPAGVTFSAPTTKLTGVSLGDIPAGHVKAIWVRRTAANSAATNGDGVVLRIEVDSGA